MTDTYYNVISTGKYPIKSWTTGVPFEDSAQEQMLNVANLPFIHKWVAAMPDVHAGMGATIGSVIPTKGAVIPAAVGVDIGCGMMAARTNMNATDLPKDLKSLRTAIERAVPHGMCKNKRSRDTGSWHNIPERTQKRWDAELAERYDAICSTHPVLKKANSINQLGTLGSGNHFIEVCLDTDDTVWIMLHSGSRGIGNKIGSEFIKLAKAEMEKYHISLPDKDLAYLPEGTELCKQYLVAVNWAQDFARINREAMMEQVLDALKQVTDFSELALEDEPINCHHNYVTKENHYGENVFVTRKGAVSAQEGELGIIPGSMGARSFIVRGKGNPESFNSCSHGAGRAMSRTEAKRRFTEEDHIAATEGVECRKDASVIDETPMAYKDIDAVMEAQEDLVEIVYTLKQVVCVKG
ncbi:MAG: RtcB family protein [Fibrobacterales bacterium]